MDGFTVKNANRFLETGNIREYKSQNFDNQGSVMGSNGVAGSKNEKSFAETLKDAVQNVNELQKNADVQMEKLATGKTDNIPEVMIAAEKADIALRLMVQVRNKVIEAYQEVMKMQV